MHPKISLLENYILLDFEELESTNLLLKTEDSFKKDRQIVRTRIQTGGRGRRGRSWISQSGDDLTFSICMDLSELDSNRWSLSSLVTGLALSDYFNSQKLPHHIKWPNDLEVQGHKISGILCETTTLNGNYFVIIGIGININSQASQYDLTPKAISMQEALGRPLDQDQVLYNFIQHFDLRWQELLNQGPKSLCKTISQRLLGKGKRVKWHPTESTEVRWVTLDHVQEDGTLAALNDQGEFVAIQSGEISWLDLLKVS